MGTASSASAAASGESLPKVEYSFQAKDQEDAEWRVLRLDLREGLSTLYECRVDLVIEDLEPDIDGLLGDSCTLAILRGSVERRLCGVVERVAFRGVAGGNTQASVWLRPALAALGQRTNSCIFQQKTAPKILQEVLEKGLEGFHRTVRVELQRSYAQREYCVQYAESDLAFVQRLMEEEGIVFYFDHSGDAEALVLVDDTSAGADIQTLDGAAVPVAGPEQATLSVESVRTFEWLGEMRPTSVVMKDYDWTRPRLSLVHQSRAKDARERDRELFMYGGAMTLAGYDQGQLTFGSDDGAVRAKLAREAQKAREQMAQGSSVVTGLTPGCIFELTGHGVTRLDQRYLVSSVVHVGQASEELTDDVTDIGAAEQRYVNRFECVAADVPFRPERNFPRPLMRGPQTAKVVGPAGEEIFTDEHGRIKVQFHWDRLGESNEKSSCFLRVVQTLAGPGFGAVFIPRIGMEVLVEFLEGDPDRPIVVGCVYNGTNASPYKLPDEKTKTVLRTMSTPGGDGYNELSFEDAAGSEQVYLQAQKDHKILVKNDKAQDVGGNETLSVKKNRDRKIEGSQTLRVDGQDTNTIGGNQSLSIGGNRQTSVSGNRNETVGGNQSTRVDGAAALVVVAALDETVGGSRQEQVAGAHNVLVGTNSSETVGGNRSQSVGGNLTESVGGNTSTDIGGTWTANIGKKLSITVTEDIKLTGNAKIEQTAKEEFKIGAKKIVINAEDELTLKVGSASVTLKKNGDLTLKGGKLEVTASGDLKLKGSKIAQN